jgi:septal ring factor EnvC (AmiA/AmiB activator)
VAKIELGERRLDVDGEIPIGLATDKVYFEWRKNGQPQNPLRWLRTRE